MPLVNVVVVLIVAGVALWAINAFIPMAAPVKKILNIVVVVAICLWLLQIFCVIGSVNDIRVR